MAKAFLKSVAEYIHLHHKDKVDEVCVVLPNKRGALFLKKYLAEVFGKNIWLPHIISIEDLIHLLSGLEVAEEVDLVCLLYESYAACYGAEAESFESFAKWGQLILQDFNEIDRFLADPAQLYDNLQHIKTIENWSLGQEELSEFQTRYLHFMASLGPIYKHYTAVLKSKKWAYQGLAYREAVSHLADSDVFNRHHTYLFCGFNAFNAAEIKIIQTFLQRQKAELLWDADTYYLNDTAQEAGSFLRQNQKHFPVKNWQFVGDHFKLPKQVSVLSVPKQIGQARVVKQHLEHLLAEGYSADKIAIVLANEKMLWPVLNQLPEAVKHVNITMSYPLQYTACYELIDLLIQLQVNFAKQQRPDKIIYHKDLLALLRHPLFQTLAVAAGQSFDWNGAIKLIHRRNLAFVTEKNVREIFGETFEVYSDLVKPQASTQEFTGLIQQLLQTLLSHFMQQTHSTPLALECEYLNVLSVNFNRLHALLSQYRYFHTWPAYKQLFTQIIGRLTAPFVGEPLQGLQVMGVLETRTLDFDHLILVNVNEGVLPAGKSTGSFIPNDLKRAFGLPLYTEKDAVYAYHFYRLLQRAESVVITYDSETDAMGKGEKSRFVTQMQLEWPSYNPSLQVVERTVVEENKVPGANAAVQMPKNALTLEAVLQKASGTGVYEALSPSSLTVFKECALKFYFRYAAKLKETEAVEEVAEANTFGSILHRALELLYSDHIGQNLQADTLRDKRKRIDAIVRQAYLEFFDNKEPTGKNILQEEVIKVYCKKVLDNDAATVEALGQASQHLHMLDLEKEFMAPLAVNIGNSNTTVYVRGKIDRLDRVGQNIRIIDYKNSVKAGDKFAFEGFEVLFEDVAYNKQLQLLMYAWLLHKNNFCEPEHMQPCIVPLKVFEKEPKFIRREKELWQFTAEFLVDFEKALAAFVAKIFDTEQAFVQTDNTDICDYCAYNLICNRNT